MKLHGRSLTISSITPPPLRIQQAPPLQHPTDNLILARLLIGIKPADFAFRDGQVRQRGQLGLFLLEQEGGEFRFLLTDDVAHAVVEGVDGVALADVLVGDAQAGDLDEAFDELGGG